MPVSHDPMYEQLHRPLPSVCLQPDVRFRPLDIIAAN